MRNATLALICGCPKMHAANDPGNEDTCQCHARFACAILFIKVHCFVWDAGQEDLNRHNHVSARFYIRVISDTFNMAKP
jgi:hypothetical protein